MPRNGSGSFSYASGYPFITGTVISSTDMNAVLLDIANTLTASIAKDGQTTATADIPMGGFKFTSIGDAVLRTQFPSTGQIQDGGLLKLGGVAGTNTITGALTPSIATTGYVTGMRILLIPAVTNTGATTLAVNSLAAKNVFSYNAACVGNELKVGVPAELVYDGTQFQIVNPQGGTLPAFSGAAITSISGSNVSGGTFGAVNGSALTALNASNIASGSLADARLSANVPLLNANNTFSNSGATTFAGTHISLNGTGFIRLDTANTFRTQGGTAGYQFMANDNTTALFTISNAGAYDFKAGTVTNTGANSQQVGFNGIPNVGVTSSDYTFGTVLALAEANWSAGYNGSGGNTFTIPSNATRAWAVGTTLHIFHIGSGTLSIAISSDTLRLAGTSSTGTRSLAANGFATAEKVASTTWLISGPGLS